MNSDGYDETPIVIIGAARSGTSILRDVIGMADQVSLVPHDVNFIWRLGVKLGHSDELPPELLTDEKIALIKKSLLSYASYRQGTRLVEKSVSNCLRIPYVSRILPNAHFVHIVRDGRDVVESAIRQWQNPPNLDRIFSKLKHAKLASDPRYLYWFAKNQISGIFEGRLGGRVWGPRFDGMNDMVGRKPLSEICAWQWNNSIEIAKAGFLKLPPGKHRITEMRYEKLVSDKTEVARLYDLLNLKISPDGLARAMDRIRGPQNHRWQSMPPDEIKRIIDIIRPCLEGLRYPIN